MKASHRTVTTRGKPHHSRRGLSKARCIRIVRRLSAYLDGELSVEICEEIRRHLGDCPNCEVFVASLRQTVSLCQHVEPLPLSPAVKARLRDQIFRAAGLS